MDFKKSMFIGMLSLSFVFGVFAAERREAVVVQPLGQSPELKVENRADLLDWLKKSVENALIALSLVDEDPGIFLDAQERAVYNFLNNLPIENDEDGTAEFYQEQLALFFAEKVRSLNAQLRSSHNTPKKDAEELGSDSDDEWYRERKNFKASREEEARVLQIKRDEESVADQSTVLDLSTLQHLQTEDVEACWQRLQREVSGRSNYVLSQEAPGIVLTEAERALYNIVCGQAQEVEAAKLEDRLSPYREELDEHVKAFFVLIVFICQLENKHIVLQLRDTGYCDLTTENKDKIFEKLREFYHAMPNESTEVSYDAETETWKLRVSHTEGTFESAVVHWVKHAYKYLTETLEDHRIVEIRQAAVQRTRARDEAARLQREREEAAAQEAARLQNKYGRRWLAGHQAIKQREREEAAAQEAARLQNKYGRRWLAGHQAIKQREREAARTRFNRVRNTVGFALFAFVADLIRHRGNVQAVRQDLKRLYNVLREAVLNPRATLHTVRENGAALVQAVRGLDRQQVGQFLNQNWTTARGQVDALVRMLQGLSREQIHEFVTRNWAALVAIVGNLRLRHGAQGLV